MTYMNARKAFLQIIGLAFMVWLFTGCTSTPTKPTIMPTTVPPTVAVLADFTGHWENTTFAFNLDLSQNGNQLQGSHVVVAQQGNRIDSMDNSIEGSVQGNIAVVHFQSSYTTNTGEAQITFIDQNTISWKVTNPPAGEYYLPAEATLVRK
jgi:hypothetical protein